MSRILLSLLLTLQLTILHTYTTRELVGRWESPVIVVALEMYSGLTLTLTRYMSRSSGLWLDKSWQYFLCICEDRLLVCPYADLIENCPSLLWLTTMFCSVIVDCCLLCGERCVLWSYALKGVIVYKHQKYKLIVYIDCMIMSTFSLIHNLFYVLLNAFIYYLKYIKINIYTKMWKWSATTSKFDKLQKLYEYCKVGYFNGAPNLQLAHSLFLKQYLDFHHCSYLHLPSLFLHLIICQRIYSLQKWMISFLCIHH